MKKLIIAALMLATITGTAYANTNYSVYNDVVSSFNKSFNNAQNVKFESQKDFIKVTFVLDGQTMFAYYKPTGEQVAVSRNIAISQLPINLATSLRQKFTDSWMTELFEVSSDGSTSYYATIQNATHITVLQADAAGNWIVFKKDKRDGQ